MKGSSKAMADKLKAWTAEGTREARIRYEADDRAFVNRTALSGPPTPRRASCRKTKQRRLRFPILEMGHRCEEGNLTR